MGDLKKGGNIAIVKDIFKRKVLVVYSATNVYDLPSTPPPLFGYLFLPHKIFIISHISFLEFRILLFF